MKALSQMTPNRGLQALFWLRTVAVLAQATVIGLAVWVLSLELPLAPMLFTVAGLAVWNAALLWRLGQPWVATHLEILLNLTIDAVALTLLLYWAGGATNPFVSLYLVPVAIAAAVLPGRYVWAISVLCVVFYSLLMVFYTPLPPVHERFGGDFNAHVFGMWVNFLLSATFMAHCPRHPGDEKRHERGTQQEIYPHAEHVGVEVPAETLMHRRQRSIKEHQQGIADDTKNGDCPNVASRQHSGRYGDRNQVKGNKGIGCPARPVQQQRQRHGVNGQVQQYLQVSGYPGLA